MFRPKCLIVMVGVLALSGFASALASAEPPGWMVNGTVLTGTSALATTARVDQNFILKFGQVEISCDGENLVLANPTINGSTRMGDTSSLEFTECTGNRVCPLAASMNQKIGTLPVLIDLTLDGALAVRGHFLPTNTSKAFFTIKFEGTECTFAGVLLARGTQAFLAPTGQDERTLQQFTTVTETSGELTFGSTSITINGSILLRTAIGGSFSFL